MNDDSEHDYDLFWHALNYRTAATEHAQYFWEQLNACVQRLVASSAKKDQEARLEIRVGDGYY